jgi:protocatechuate 3,4-dioxygenase beta subunit
MHCRLLSVLSVLLAASSVAQNPATENSASDKSTFVVEGRVDQGADAQPIRKVDVSLVPREGRQNDQYAATTDAEGKFQIRGVKPGRYRVVLQHVSFRQSGGRMGTPLILNSAADARNLVFHMQAGATISGKVVDSDGDPMANVSVQAMRVGSNGRRFAGDHGYASTNDLGEYRIGNLRAGSYLVSADAVGQHPPKTKDGGPGKSNLGYVPTYYPGSLDQSQAVPVELRAGEETPVTITPLASQRFSIRGTVTKPAGAKLANLMLRSADNRPVYHDSDVSEDGSFEFRDLLPGSYRFFLMVLDLTSIMADAQAGRTPQVQVMRLGQPIAITNANVDGLHLVPETPGHVRGRFRMDKERKMDWTQLSVMLSSEDSSEIMLGNLPAGATARVQADGTFDLPKVAAGEYRLAVTSNANNLADYYTKSVNLEGKDVADSGFSVSGGTYSLDVVVSADGATVEGTAVDDKGKPVADATVVAAPNGERRKRFDVFAQDKSDAQGHFKLRGLISGEYTVLAWEDPDGNVRDPEFLNGYEDRGEKVQLDDAARKTVSVTVIAAEESPE